MRTTNQSYTVIKDILLEVAREKGVPLGRLARQAGLRANSFYEVIHGETKSPSIKTCRRIADVTGMRVQDVIDIFYQTD